MDDTYQCLMIRQQTVQKSFHRPTRAICHDRRDQNRHSHREKQKNLFAALSLVLSIVVRWNTQGRGSVITRQRWRGECRVTGAGVVARRGHG
ncbi:Tn3 family transposase [Streptomyces sp. NPDC059639]|uniref:Tn3 family transposase n=1 Tax=Streptomyces sp. NPDC059639 TaxID=3346891 RepID=UPI0036C7D775